MTPFEELLKVEKRIKKCAEEILTKYGGEGSSVEWHGFNGFREDNESIDGRMDLLGFDAELYIRGERKPMTVQVKVGSSKNFEMYGKGRQSLTLGPSNSVLCTRYVRKHVESYDLLLTGYETEEGVLSPYALIYWQPLIRKLSKKSCKVVRYNEDMNTGSIHLFEDSNVVDNNRFIWTNYWVIEKLNVVASDCQGNLMMDFSKWREI